MNVTTSCQPSLEPGVAEFLKSRAAEVEFQTTCELVRTCFPEARGLGAYMQEDPDEDNRWYVILQITLPASYPLDPLGEQRRRFSEELVERLPPAKFPEPVCGLMLIFARET
jgi:hypothetical protein